MYSRSPLSISCGGILESLFFSSGVTDALFEDWEKILDGGGSVLMHPKVSCLDQGQLDVSLGLSGVATRCYGTSQRCVKGMHF